MKYLAALCLLCVLSVCPASSGDDSRPITFELSGAGQLRVLDGDSLILELKTLEALQQITSLIGVKGRDIELKLPKSYGSSTSDESQTRATIAMVEATGSRLGCRLKRVLVHTGGLVSHEIPWTVKK